MKKLFIAVIAALFSLVFFSCQKGATVVPSTVPKVDTPSSPTTYTTVALTGDQLTVTPVAGDSLNITAATTNTYNCLNNRLISAVSSDTISFPGVAVPTSNYCTGGQAKAISTISMAPTTDGRHSFIIKFNNVVYSGSFVKNGNTYTFSWPYTSGVVISPLSVTK